MSRPAVPPVAVLDSSVLVPVWSRHVLQRLAIPGGGVYSPVWSEWIIAETWRVLTWRWRIRLDYSVETSWRSLVRDANLMLRRFLAVMTLVSLRDYAGPDPWPELRDEDDVPIWQTAVVARAQYVVSHNLSDFPPLIQGRHTYAGIEYVTAIEFVEDVLGEDAAAIYGAPLPAAAPIRSNRVAERSDLA